jgi:phosphoglycolate phosphatase
MVSGRINPGEVDELERAFRSVYDGGAWERATLFPEVHSTLDALVDAGTRLFVVTNKPHVPAERILTHLGVFPLLTALRSPDQCEPSYKTKAEAVEGLRADFALECEHTLMVGDALDDAQAAAAFGCQFAGVDYGYGAACSQREYPVHFRISGFGELISIVTGKIPATHTY